MVLLVLGFGFAFLAGLLLGQASLMESRGQSREDSSPSRSAEES